MVSLPLSRQLGIGEATANGLCHGKGGAVFVGKRIVLRGVIVEPKHLLCDVAVEVERFDSNVGALQAALQETLEVLDSLGLDLAPTVFFDVVYRVVNEVLFGKVAVAACRIGADGRLFSI